WMSPSAQPELASDWQAVQARGAHRGRARLSGPLPSSRMREDLSMLHSTSLLFSCLTPFLLHPKINAAEAKYMKISGPHLVSLCCSLGGTGAPPMTCKA